MNMRRMIPLLFLWILPNLGTAQTTLDAKEILLKAVQASGGLDKLKAVENFSIKTQNVIFQPSRKTELTITEIAELPDKSKQIWQLEQGQRIQVLNGGQSWKQMGKEISDLTKAEKREMQKGLIRTTINVFKESDSSSFSVEYVGKESLAGESSYVLLFTHESGDFFRMYIDTHNFFVTKKTYQGAPEVGLAFLEEIYSDYRKVEGIAIPFHTEVRANGRKFIETDVVEAKFNIDLKDDFFFRR